MIKNKTSGFTLLELLIVIAIIGVLASLLVPALIGAQKRSYDAGAQACAKSIQTAQGIAQVDNRTFLLIGGGADKLNRSTDGINPACLLPDVFIKERSSAADIVSAYTIDVWDRRGSKVFTITPQSFIPNAPGATAFSNTGAGSSNMP
ncbi:type II secretion system protein [Deinococcus maricopensis]|uniref:type II secretion system protein n=1 Tax=Deinococcus maricopensis TaxID=309887 RepID=UPI000A060455|nr:type II secretion system protein [Deinococcus maricopensis]